MLSTFPSRRNALTFALVFASAEFYERYANVQVERPEAWLGGTNENDSDSDLDDCETLDDNHAMVCTSHVLAGAVWLGSCIIVDPD